ncbi:tRNA threonylcarbamoyladenosine dehydratase [Conchiformibius kuhniae]|uniref:ThiF family adenylyltransferase n=1 Tax=Conchiformibius kuhniae TaxID=211502 RepID=A0A8T9MRQ1_9NEIS|nr:tRNA threonylcarbamoyladenosine dehydratase [Conchiformibius kuhniae]UOP04580.1 tRNA threonylcarbamoyladenosine dehydratase [Conchiformibius kuhniae]
MFEVSDRSRRFGGIARLYGTGVADALARAHVCLVGIGGVGSWAAEALARSGIGALTLIDPDNVAVSNTNRQIHALTPTFGQAKTAAMRERIAAINPDCRVCEVEDFADEQNLPELLSPPFDFVIDAIDQVRVKAALAAHCVRTGKPLAVSGGAGGQRHPSLIRSGDLASVTHDRLLANMRYLLRRHHGFARAGAGKMGVWCVYSSENVVAPQTESCDAAPQGLSCAGYGASMLVTAAFGLHLAHAAVEHIATTA